jgi:glycosyltransferase 2 family protein
MDNEAFQKPEGRTTREAPAGTSLRAIAGQQRSDSKPKFWRSPFMRIGGSALILTLLLTYLPFHQVWSAMKRIPPLLGVGLLCAYLALHLLGVVKWRLLINLAGADLTFFQSIRCYYGGLFANIFLPSLVGGDVVRAGMAFTVSRSRAAIVLGSLLDRVQDVIGLAAVATIGALLLPRSLDAHSRRVFWAVGIALVVGGALGVGALFLVPARKFPLKILKIVVKLRRGIRSMSVSPGRMFLCFNLGLILQVSQVAINFWLGEVSGLRVAFSLWLFGWPLAKLSALLPVTQGGIGVREAALVGLLAPFGAPPVRTAAVGLVFQAIVISGGLLGGVIAFLLGRLSSAQPETPDIAAFGKDREKVPNGVTESI